LKGFAGSFSVWCAEALAILPEPVDEPFLIYDPPSLTIAKKGAEFLKGLLLVKNQPPQIHGATSAEDEIRSRSEFVGGFCI